MIERSEIIGSSILPNVDTFSKDNVCMTLAEEILDIVANLNSIYYMIRRSENKMMIDDENKR